MLKLLLITVLLGDFATEAKDPLFIGDECDTTKDCKKFDYTECRKDGGGTKRCLCLDGYKDRGDQLACIRITKANCTCGGSGDTHYVLYDDLHLTNQGYCSYRLTWLICEGCGEFIVDVKTSKTRQDISKVAKVIIKPDDTDTVVLDLDSVTVSNGTSQTSVKGQYYEKAGSYIVNASAKNYVYVWNSCTNVQWNYDHSVLVTTVKWCAATGNGICGSCNDNKTDDLVTRSGEYVGDKAGWEDLIVTSWWQQDYGEDEIICNKTTACEMSQEELQKLKDRLIIDEGNVNHIYVDTNGVKHFGIGHKITNKDPEHGKPVDTPVTEERIQEAFKQDVNQALKDLGKWVAECKDGLNDCNKLPDEVKQILSNMMFQIGLTNMNKFKKLRNAVCDGDWDKAADEMADSKWATEDSPERAKRLIDRMRALAAP